MTGARLVWLFVRLGVLHELAYGGNLFIQIVSSTFGLAAALIFLAAVFAHTNTLAGWRSPELLALLGAFFLLTGVLGTVVQPSLQAFIDDVRQGTLDFTLTKPPDAQVLVSIRQVDIWKLVDVGVGMGLVVVALVQLDQRVGPAQAAGFVLTLVAGGATIYSCCLILASLAFWFIRVDNVLIVFLTFWEAGRWPVDVYPVWLRSTLTFLVPVAFATTVPAEALSGRLRPATLLVAIAVASGLLAISRLLWLRGLRRYSGASA
ncbi:MAG: ABC-2 family transporter protein [Chloroflexota bacterium]|nr:ABC-2 family transporter protein [Chloroflexota bacterium]